jgi:hypothetical protein
MYYTVMNEYRTNDFHLAAFLRASGLQYKGIEHTDEKMKSDFVFFVPDSIDLKELLRERRNDMRTSFIREVLIKASNLKADIRNSIYP